MLEAPFLPTLSVLTVELLLTRNEKKMSLLFYKNPKSPQNAVASTTFFSYHSPSGKTATQYSPPTSTPTPLPRPVQSSELLYKIKKNITTFFRQLRLSHTAFKAITMLWPGVYSVCLPLNDNTTPSLEVTTSLWVPVHLVHYKVGILLCTPPPPLNLMDMCIFNTPIQSLEPGDIVIIRSNT